MGEPVGTVATLARFPVKSMQGERLATVELLDSGLVGDRAYALIEAETGRAMSAKNPRLGPKLLKCRAEFVEPPGSGGDLPPVRITLPDGGSVTSDAPDVDATLSGFLGREVSLQRSAPDDCTIDQAGIASPVPAGSFVDLFPVSVLTTSTLAQLQALRPESRFDERRFRMNVVVDTPDRGFVENAWTGRSLEIGDTARLMISLSDPRCIMTTLAQGDLPKDTEILRTLVRHNQVEVAGGLYPCAGVYAVVTAMGLIRAGDHASLVEA